jgi:hypothetical protein
VFDVSDFSSFFRMCCSLQKQSAHDQRTATRNFCSSYQHSEETPVAVVWNFQYWLQMVLGADDEYNENVLM